ncbi:signal-transducing adaptor protein 2b [Pimephales promelas]|uniref:signal-transducing adaptor protein 2b n=1 Tax=Pimephales promelas TaxID=90988 RepID=UPI001955F4F5|nr:signal-transducing adaptor protein 2b [Pimephales promelas]KAG1973549.1 signal-transducing adaptor protein [Pimephales promelas]
MASANRHRRVRSQLPTCYYEGFLEKKTIKDKMGRKLWTSLCGNALFFYNNTKDSVYIEKLELSDLNSVSDDCCHDRNLNAAGFTLHMKKEDIKMIAPSLEARELWKGYMLSVSRLSVPALNLLPGQIHMMKEIIDKETKRQRLLSAPPPSQDSDPYVHVVPDMPSCYHNVTRVEAEILLERNSAQGNLLLRPGQDGMSFALTTRQDINKPVFKHYRVSRRPEGGFIIALETPITCATLHDVVTYVVDKADGVLVPLVIEEHYEKNFVIVKPNEENGEISEHCLRNAPSPTPPLPPPKPGTRNLSPNSESYMHENEYLNCSDIGEYEEAQDRCMRSLPLPHPPDGQRKALVPPGYGKTPSRSNSMSGLPEKLSRRELSVDLNELQDAFRRRGLQE